MTDSSLTESRQKVEDNIHNTKKLLAGSVDDGVIDLITRYIDISYDYGCLDALQSAKVSLDK